MRQSLLFSSTRREAPRDEESKNAILLMRGGYVLKTMAGVYSYLPLGLRVLRKVMTIVREEMDRLPGAQEVLLPALQPRELWQESGRWEDIADVMYTLEEGTLGLGPTHEEIVTDLFRRMFTSYKDLPKAVFQIQTKFRKEARAKSGLLRGREFWMKDLYSFHETEADLEAYYQLAIEAYRKVYARCGLEAILTEADGGVFAKYSHEFQVISEAGEDTIFVNEAGDYARNLEIVPKEEAAQFAGQSSIEVGNIFKLNRKFSTPMAATVSTESGEKVDVWMGCYGIGISRLMGTVVECFGDSDGKIKWPEELAPYRVHLLDLTPDQQAEAVYAELQAAGVEVLLDDRDRSAGEKFTDADLIGAPVRVVVSKRSLAAGGFEVMVGEISEVVPLAELKLRLLLED